MAENEGEWSRVASLDELRENKASRAMLGDEALVLVRVGERVWAGSDRCTHQGAALHRGSVRPAGGSPAITCPAHGSVFQLSDGRVLHGPASTPIPVYEARVVEGAVEVRPGA